MGSSISKQSSVLAVGFVFAGGAAALALYFASGLWPAIIGLLVIGGAVSATENKQATALYAIVLLALLGVHVGVTAWNASADHAASSTAADQNAGVNPGTE